MSSPLSRKLRFEILRRDGHRCRYCGATKDEVRLEVDHIHPRSRGGDDDPDNLVTACFDCNRGKRDRLLLIPEPLRVAESRADWAEQLALKYLRALVTFAAGPTEGGKVTAGDVVRWSHQRPEELRASLRWAIGRQWDPEFYDSMGSVIADAWERHKMGDLRWWAPAITDEDHGV